MKKTYVKPMIVFESFKLTTNIANGGTCDKKVGNPSEGTCGIPTAPGSPITLFDSSVGAGCTMTGVDGVDGCYHVPEAGLYLFNS
ncbi:MAG: hypothetical protein E7658_05365 [Ruminococcaceae bacterium]|nr:hypothetical protein [Oscillospiraceae bacterium]